MSTINSKKNESNICKKQKKGLRSGYVSQPQLYPLSFIRGNLLVAYFGSDDEVYAMLSLQFDEFVLA